MPLTDYLLLAELGRGKDGRVLKAMGPRGVVALKLPHGDARAHYRHALEADWYEALAGCDAIPGLIERGAPSEPFLALRYAAGGSLVRARVGDADRVVDRVRACSAALHARGVYLPTLGPDDVLLDDKGDVRLCDLAAAVPLTPLARHELEPLAPALRGRGWTFDPLRGPDVDLPYALLRLGLRDRARMPMARRPGAFLRGEVDVPELAAGADVHRVTWDTPALDVTALLTPGVHSATASVDLAAALAAQIRGRCFVLRLPRAYTDAWFLPVLFEQIRVKARMLPDATLRTLLPPSLDPLLAVHHAALARRLGAEKGPGSAAKRDRGEGTPEKGPGSIAPGSIAPGSIAPGSIAPGSDAEAIGAIAAIAPCTIVRLVPRGLVVARPPAVDGVCWIDVTEADALLHPSGVVAGAISSL
ncbi:MAG: hypothetical protein IT381_13580 [Deltaproteobacteria bacterium]|nr:hypothetical protein [Deltaproteobacteria bacterium]